MRALEKFAMPAFLDSANHGGTNGSTDILAADPIAYMQIENGVFSASSNAALHVGQSTNSYEFFNYIRLLRELFIPLVKESSRPGHRAEHAGSVIAHIGYPELANIAEFFINDAFVGFYLWTIVVDHEQSLCELRMHPKCSAAHTNQTLSAIEESLSRLTSVKPGVFLLESQFSNETSHSEYQKAFTNIKAHINSGDCYQVNLSQSFTAKASGSPLAAYLKLREATTAPFSAYIDWGSGALLSLSPERFVRVNDNAVLTQPVKGTRPRGLSDEEDAALAQELAGSEKDRAENLMIVDLLRNDLGRVCEIGSIYANQLFTIESFSNVHHMVSDINGKLSSNKDAIDLLESCYPGGSITGAPKLAAMKVIKEIELSPRRVYCGTVFYLNSVGSFDSSITIRSLLWQSGLLSCWAGGGIVADSDCDQEYQECFDKINNIFNTLKSIS